MKIKRMLKEELFRYKSQLFLLIVLQLIFYITLVAAPYITGTFADVLLNKDTGNIRNIIIAFAIISCVYLVSSYQKEVVSIGYKERVSANLNETVIAHLQNIPILKVMKYDPVSLGHQITMDTELSVALITDFLTNIIISALVVITALGAIFVLNKTAFIPIICLIAIYIVTYFLMKDKISEKSIGFKNAQNSFFSKQTEQLVKVKLIKQNASEAFFVNRTNGAIEQLVTSGVAYMRIFLLFQKTVEFLNKAATAILFIIAGTMVIAGKMSIGEFIIINTYYEMILTNTKDLSEALSYYRSTYASLERVEKLLLIEEEVSGEALPEKIEQINIADMSFSYDETKTIISNLSTKLEKGKIYLVKGFNGKGKSTLLNIVAGMYMDYQGDIFFNDKELREIQKNDLRKNEISIVEQDTVLINGTLKDNLLLGIKKQVQDTEIEWYLRQFNMEKFIPQLNTQVDVLSGGECQKIAIIRSFLKDASVFLFDEPTSALDESSIENLKRLLRERKENKIVYIIIHGDKLDDICDEIIEW